MGCLYLFLDYVCNYIFNMCIFVFTSIYIRPKKTWIFNSKPLNKKWNKCSFLILPCFYHIQSCFWKCSCFLLLQNYIGLSFSIQWYSIIKRRIWQNDRNFRINEGLVGAKWHALNKKWGIYRRYKQWRHQNIHWKQ